MSTHEVTRAGTALATLALAALLAGCTAPGDRAPGDRAPAAAPGALGIGRAPTAAEIRGWDIDVAPDGTGLPEGSGSVAQGRTLYAAQCASCHGDAGQGGIAPRLVGGLGSLASKSPVRTIGSYWPYATTVYDYIHRAMPLNQPLSLKPSEVYALTAFLLHADGIVGADAVLDRRSLPAVRMPNRDGFVRSDERPDTRGERCMRDCR